MTNTSTHQDIRRLLALAADHYRSGRLGDAETHYRTVVASVPEHASAHYNIAVILKTQGRLPEAAEQYRHVLSIKPDNAKAHSNLAIILAEQGYFDEAVSHYEAALAIDPDFANAHYNLAGLLQQHGRLDEAAFHYRAASTLKPDDPDARNNYAIVLQRLGKLDQAAAQYEQGRALKPDDARIENNYGTVLKDQGRLNLAAEHLLKALAAAPDYADALYNLGTVRGEQGKFDEAERCYLSALAIDPDHARVHNNLALLRHQQGRLDEALAGYARAQALSPDYPDAHWNEALTRLAVGEFETGWQKYEWRWKTDLGRPRHTHYPLWTGEDLTGRTILLHAEQGLGDTLQFVRYAPLVAARGGRVILEVQPELVSLIGRMTGVAMVRTLGAPLPPLDCQISLMSLPSVFGTNLETIPATTPYLSADPGDAERWKQRLSRLPGLKVGVVWAGASRRANRAAHMIDRRRSMSFSEFASLLDVSNVSFVSLQKDSARTGGAAQHTDLAFHDWTEELDDFAATAALVEALDLVIGVDTSVIHLAGALGKPVWMLNRFDSCWRWLRGRDDSPWYPTLRQFRQTIPGDWKPVLANVRRDLAILAG